MARSKGAIDVVPRKRKCPPGAAAVRDECAARFKRRTGRAVDEHTFEALRAQISNELAMEAGIRSAAKELRRLDAAVGGLEALVATSPSSSLKALRALLDDLRDALGKHAAIIADARDLANFTTKTARAMLVAKVDTESFFGTGRAASDEDLAVISFLMGIATVRSSERSKSAAMLIDRERATMAKLRRNHGIVGKRDTAAKTREMLGRLHVVDPAKVMARLIERLRNPVSLPFLPKTFVPKK